MGYKSLEFLNHCHNRPDRPFDADQAAAVGFAVVAVQFADIRAVGYLAGIGFRIVAGLPGGTVVVADQAGEVEKGIFAGVVPAEIQGVTAGVHRCFATVPVLVTATVGRQTEIVVAARCQFAHSPSAFEGSLCQYHGGIHVERGSRRHGGLQGVLDEVDLLCCHTF